MRMSHTFNAVYAAVMFLIGAALLAAWLLLDLDSFPNGFCLGGGLTLLLGSVYFAVMYVWRGNTDPTGTDYWLPSRDRGENP